ncbi:MAG: TonB-dependent receptor [Gemmatimonadetes bacterium]|nr:TonB-dependent receptor [Gemmatimonadota bacterium]MCA9768305.1 TonB-dependent receptor [Gemmatimonadota bacterium]MCB9518585.1 TonB-dependent receptor [Gemmatimonadales bacterium]HPF62211.1 TonB-dependent receptor [Gemmatimonadales bacterium]HRX18823.1 TonB-dependent receptor [Gemmatimonadales bacterium]
MRGWLIAPLLVGLVAAPLTAQSPDPLDRRVSLDVRDVSLGEALLRLRHAHQLPLAWRGDRIPRRRVSVSRSDVRLGDLLDLLLRDTELVAVVSGSTVVLIGRRASAVTDTLGLQVASGIQQLDQLVVTGTPVGTGPAGDQPTALTVVTANDLAAAPHRRLADQVRAFLPGVLPWDRGGTGPAPTLGAVRGVASFTTRGPKVYVDGVEVASSELFTLLDGRMVDRLEMIHGPQGAALYGPDALSGVLQVETRKGPPVATALAPRGALVAGALQRDIDGGSPWFEGALGADAGRPTAGFAGMASVSRLGHDAPLAEAWRVQVGGRVTRGAVAVEMSARAASRDGNLEQQGLTTGGLRRRDVPPLEERGLGVRMVHVAGASLSQTLVAGVHQVSGTREPFRSPILAPRLPLGATNELARRWSARWAGRAVAGPLSLSVGAEASRRTLERSLRGGFESVGLSTLYAEALDARGVFTQLAGRLGGVHLVAGARQEWLSSVGREADRPWAAMAGASWSHALGPGTLRVRLAWGRALRPPEPGMSEALRAGQIQQLANPVLRAERQAGWEGGVDLFWPSGAWLRLTGFDQRADDLVQQVDLRQTAAGARQYQFQNVGGFTNRGVELDGGARVGPLAAAARVQLLSSRLAQVSPTYAGDFQVGDAPLEVPRSAGSIALRYEPGRARVEVGALWVGPWTGYDWALIARIDAGQLAVRDRTRDYWLDYPGVLRPFVGLHAPLGGRVALWGRAEFGGGTVRDNLAPAVGRVMLVGVEM